MVERFVSGRETEFPYESLKEAYRLELQNEFEYRQATAENSKTKRNSKAKDDDVLNTSNESNNSNGSDMSYTGASVKPGKGSNEPNIMNADPYVTSSDYVPKPYDDQLDDSDDWFFKE